MTCPLATQYKFSPLMRAVARNGAPCRPAGFLTTQCHISDAEAGEAAASAIATARQRVRIGVIVAPSLSPRYLGAADDIGGAFPSLGPLGTGALWHRLNKSWRGRVYANRHRFYRLGLFYAGERGAGSRPVAVPQRDHKLEFCCPANRRSRIRRSSFSRLAALVARKRLSQSSVPRRPRVHGIVGSGPHI